MEKAKRAKKWIAHCDNALNFGRSCENSKHIQPEFIAHVEAPSNLEDTIQNLKNRYTRLSLERTSSRSKVKINHDIDSFSESNASAETDLVDEGEKAFARFLASFSQRDEKLYENVTEASKRLDAAIVTCAAKWELEGKTLSCVVEFMESLRQVAEIMAIGGDAFGPAGGVQPPPAADSTPASPSHHKTSIMKEAMREEVQKMRSIMGMDDEHGDEEDWGMDSE